MDGRCEKHQFEAAEDMCRTCGYGFCTECLVYSFGESKPPFCVACALAAAGVRSTAGNAPRMSRREMRKTMRQRHRETVAAASEESAPAVAKPVIDIEWAVPLDATPVAQTA